MAAGDERATGVSCGRETAIQFLLGRIDYERALGIPYDQREFRLDRMRDLVARLGNPQDRLKIVHIAGTKGKGSTAAMIASVLSSAGYRTGLYTSPHLERLEERFVVDSLECSDKELAELVECVRPIVEEMDAQYARHEPTEMGPTYFEITTAMAFLHFAVRQVDFAVIEVGMGGRLDSTNVCRPLVSVITSISFDHTKQLGNTLGQIAREKAGIIKFGVPVVSGVTENEPRGVTAEVANGCSAKLLQVGVDFEYDYVVPANFQNSNSNARGLMNFRLHRCASVEEVKNIEIGLLGRHQAANAAVALATLSELRALGWNIPEVAIRQGLAQVRLPARVEIVSERPTVVIDAAHNVASIRSLLDTLTEQFPPGPRILIFGTTQDKDIRGMLELLLPQFETVIFTRYSNNLSRGGNCCARRNSR